MERIKVYQLLASKLSKVQVLAITKDLHYDDCSIAELFSLMFQSDFPRMAYNAAWVLASLSSEDKNNHLYHRYEQLVTLATSETLCFRRGLVLSILEGLPIEKITDTVLLDYCLKHIMDIAESDNSRSCMIRLAARMCKPYPELCNELMSCLDIVPDSSKSIVSAKRNALKIINR